MMPLQERLQQALTKRKKQGNYRQLKSYDGFLDFFSNDYLGLAQYVPQIKSAPSFGGSSRLIAGTSSLILELEKELALHFSAPTALIFNSGFTANLGVLSTLPQKGDVVLYDSLVHASIREGLRLTNAKSYKFKHNNVDHLHVLLKKYSQQTCFVVVESLYSMDGDFAPLKEIEKLCNEYNVQLIIDEAHRAGVIQLEPTINSDTIRIVTFGKAYGSYGSCVLCNEVTRHYLINFCKTFIYTTAPTQHTVLDIQHKVLQQNSNIARKQLQSNISFFRTLFVERYELKSAPNSPIQTLYLDSLKLKVAEKALHDHQIGIKAIYPPTVPKGEERIRICLHAFNTKNEITHFFKVLSQNI